jgi:hypothetical protein
MHVVEGDVNDPLNLAAASAAPPKTHDITSWQLIAASP